MKCSLRLSLIVPVLLVGHFALSQSDAFLWTSSGGMQDLGVLAGWQDSAGGGINNTGTIVGSLSRTDGDRQDVTSFGWRSGIGMRYLDGLSFTNSLPYAINNRGQVVGTSHNASGQYHAFLWTREGKAKDLGTLGGQTSGALAINNLGQIVGVSQMANGSSHAFLWTQEQGMQDLMTLTHQSCPNCASTAYGINDDGVIVGQLSGNLDAHFTFAYVWKNGYGKSLGDLGGTGLNRGSVALGINYSGQVVGLALTSSGDQHAFLWTEAGGMQDLGTLSGGSASEATGINSLGQVVGWSLVTGLGDTHAFLWNPTTGMQDLGHIRGPDQRCRRD
jgi:probable HAF family extracellular repeat protein